MKKIFKIATFIFALSMVMGLGMVKEVKAAPDDRYHYCHDMGLTHADSSCRHTKSTCPEHSKCCCYEAPEEDESSSTDITLQNSVEAVNYDSLNKTEGTDYFTDETTNVWDDGQIVEEVRVTVNVESAFTITIPKEIVLDGQTKKADYTVNVQGDIAGDQKITVTPDETFEMAEVGGKANVTATVTQNDKEFVYNEISPADGKTIDGSIEALDLTAGEWSGKYMFNIKFE